MLKNSGMLLRMFTFLISVCSLLALHSEVFEGQRIGDFLVYRDNKSSYRIEQEDEKENYENSVLQWFLDPSHTEEFLHYANPMISKENYYDHVNSNAHIPNIASVDKPRLPRYPKPDKVLPPLPIESFVGRTSDAEDEKKANEVLKNVKDSMHGEARLSAVDTLPNANSGFEDATPVVNITENGNTTEAEDMNTTESNNSQNLTSQVMGELETSTSSHNIVVTDVIVPNISTYVSPKSAGSSSTAFQTIHSNRLKVVATGQREVQGYHIVASFLFCFGAFFFLLAVCLHCYFRRRGHRKANSDVKFNYLSKKTETNRSDLEKQP